MELLATEYPRVNFIIPHLGSFADDWAAQSALIPHLERYENVYTDTAGVRRFDLLSRAVEPGRSAQSLIRQRWTLASPTRRAREGASVRFARR